MIKTFPFYKQLDSMDCGPTCIRIVTSCFGKEYTLETLREKYLINKEENLKTTKLLYKNVRKTLLKRDLNKISDEKLFMIYMKLCEKLEDPGMVELHGWEYRNSKKRIIYRS